MRDLHILSFLFLLAAGKISYFQCKPFTSKLCKSFVNIICTLFVSKADRKLLEVFPLFLKSNKFISIFWYLSLVVCHYEVLQ